MESVAFDAGRIMLQRLDQLADQRANFAFETTLSSRTFAPFLRRLIESGYDGHLVFFWVPAPELNILRVTDRVRRGGHFVKDEDVRRRLRDNTVMPSNGEVPSIETIRNSNLTLEGIREAFRDTFREHKLLGLPIAVWKDGKAVWLQPEEITPEMTGESPAAKPPQP